MPSIADNVPSKAEQKPTPSYKHLAAAKLQHIDSKLSVFNSLYYFNIFVILLAVFRVFPEINLLIIGAHICMAALIRLLRVFIRPDEVDNLSAHVDEHDTCEEMASIRHKLELEMERSSKLAQRNEQLLRDLNEQEKVLTSEEKGSFNIRCKEYKLTPTEEEALLQVFEKAQDSLKKVPPEAAEAVVFRL
ncbi:MAG: hypothetical protein OHK93_007227 [Ramalina farinacea]|uniref:Uncharacterized protein n=1 Tax=Ramalina farinacea TaxID=258253 RepID=A0AA43TTU7_9LECA|nr:hypothetical protein [Ramalina farinacea]